MRKGKGREKGSERKGGEESERKGGDGGEWE